MGHNYIGHTCIGHNYECVRRCVRRARARAACRRASRRRHITGARIGRLGGGLPAVGGLDRRRNSRQSGRRRTALRRCADLRTPSTHQPVSRGTSTPLRRACFGPAGPDRACYGGKARRCGNGANEGGSHGQTDRRGQTDGWFGPNASKDAPRPDRPGTDRAFGSAITPWRPPRVGSTRPARPNT